MIHQPHILLVDDDEIEVEVLLRAFHQHHFDCPVTAVRDGLEALRVLRNPDGDSSLPRPSLMLLDLYLPRLSGLDFLLVLRQDPALKWLPVFVLTYSNNQQDIWTAYRYGIAGYILKDKTSQHPQALIQLLTSYFALVSLPASDHLRRLP